MTMVMMIAPLPQAKQMSSPCSRFNTFLSVAAHNGGAEYQYERQ